MVSKRSEKSVMLYSDLMFRHPPPHRHRRSCTGQAGLNFDMTVGYFWNQGFGHSPDAQRAKAEGLAE
jgi:hypothetical protein